MPFPGPGLESKPPEDALVQFATLMPSKEKKPNAVVNLLKLPLRLLSIPVKVVGKLCRLPKRVFTRAADPNE